MGFVDVAMSKCKVEFKAPGNKSCAWVLKDKDTFTVHANIVEESGFSISMSLFLCIV